MITSGIPAVPLPRIEPGEGDSMWSDHMRLEERTGIRFTHRRRYFNKRVTTRYCAI